LSEPLSSKHIGDRLESEVIQVGRPLPRETIRATESGILANCSASHCNWQGLFPNSELAKQAVETHYDHALEDADSRTRAIHMGSRTYQLTALLDAETAQQLDTSNPGLGTPGWRSKDQTGSVREPVFPRTTGSVDELVGRGDVIERAPYHQNEIVKRVSQTRSAGLPTWTVVFVAHNRHELETLDDATVDDLHYINECIARDGKVYERYGEDPLNNPAFDVVGGAEHQAHLHAFATGGGRGAE